MTRTVFVSTSQKLVAKTIEDARAKAELDTTVDVISYSPPTGKLDDVAGQVVVVGVRPKPTTLPARVVRRAERTKPGRALRRLISGGLSRRMWATTKRNPAARGLLDGADVVVALDTAAIRTAWHLARKRPATVVVYGPAAVPASSATASASRP